MISRARPGARALTPAARRKRAVEILTSAERLADFRPFTIPLHILIKRKPQ